ncbi:GSCOCG00008757001-RA-CDS [Cotesia congregata]|nr:GSCOCG00008757001-RA-CDS [Cotesia congregata]
MNSHDNARTVTKSASPSSSISECTTVGMYGFINI